MVYNYAKNVCLVWWYLLVSTYVGTSLAVGENYSLTFSHYEDYNRIIVELSPKLQPLWCIIDDLTNDPFNVTEQPHLFGCGTAEAVNESSEPKWNIIKVVLQDCHQVQLRCGNSLGNNSYDLSNPLTVKSVKSEELHNVGNYITYRWYDAWCVRHAVCVTVWPWYLHIITFTHCTFKVFQFERTGM